MNKTAHILMLPLCCAVRVREIETLRKLQAFESALRDVANDVDGVEVHVGPPKSSHRFKAKVHQKQKRSGASFEEEARNIKDVLRGSIILEDPSDVPKIYRRLARAQGCPFNVVTLKNKCVQKHHHMHVHMPPCKLVCALAHTRPDPNRRTRTQHIHSRTRPPLAITAWAHRLPSRLTSC